MRISFVCSGNICRSPTAEIVMRALVADAGLAADVAVESAGTGAWHVGQGLDRRSAAELRRRGYDVPRHRARQFDLDDFDRLDLVVALDDSHLDDLRTLAPDEPARAKVALLGSFGTAHRDDPSVPDPYYGGVDGFADVLARVEDGCRGLLARIAADRPGHPGDGSDASA